MATREQKSIVICGAGIAGLATAYWLAVVHGRRDILIVDPVAPMSLTSAASGENYRNWWPQPELAAFADRSIALMRDLAGDGNTHFRMSRGGYAYVTRRQDTDAMIGEIERVYGHGKAGDVRVHDHGKPIPDADNGADILLHREAIRARFPHLNPDVRAVTLVRRAGDIDSQQMGQFMLNAAKARGVGLAPLEIEGIAENGRRLEITASSAGEAKLIEADIFINAAGPFAKRVGRMLGVDLPIDCVFQQKIAFEDVHGVVPRNAPFTIDQDAGPLDWPDEVRELLREDPETAPLAQEQPGGVHVRPEGGEASRWVKLGWATNKTAEPPVRHPTGADTFPEIVMRGAARLVPGLAAYCEDMPRNLSHYGGYYTRTPENWPLIGPVGPPGAFMIAGLSGYGTMMACAAAELCAAWVTGSDLPALAHRFSLERYTDERVMAEFADTGTDGEL